MFWLPIRFLIRRDWKVFEASENPEVEETVFENDGTGIRSSLIPVLLGIYRNRIDSFREIFTGSFCKADENCMGAQKERSTWLLKNL